MCDTIYNDTTMQLPQTWPSGESRNLLYRPYRGMLKEKSCCEYDSWERGDSRPPPSQPPLSPTPCDDDGWITTTVSTLTRVTRLLWLRQCTIGVYQSVCISVLSHLTGWCRRVTLHLRYVYPVKAPRKIISVIATGIREADTVIELIADCTAVVRNSLGGR